MTGASHEAMTRAFLDLILAGKIVEATENFLTPDFVWDNPLPAGIPFGGRFDGRAGAVDYLGLIFDNIEMEEFVIDEVVASGDRVVVLGREASYVRATGRRYRMNWVHVLHIRDGQAPQGRAGR